MLLFAANCLRLAFMGEREGDYVCPTLMFLTRARKRLFRRTDEVTHTSKICYLNLLVHTDERKFIPFTLNLHCGANKRARVRDFLSYISIGNPMNAVEFSQNCTSLLASAI